MKRGDVVLYSQEAHRRYLEKANVIITPAMEIGIRNLAKRFNDPITVYDTFLLAGTLLLQFRSVDARYNSNFFILHSEAPRIEVADEEEI